MKSLALKSNSLFIQTTHKPSSKSLCGSSIMMGVHCFSQLHIHTYCDAFSRWVATPWRQSTLFYGQSTLYTHKTYKVRGCGSECKLNFCNKLDLAFILVGFYVLSAKKTFPSTHKHNFVSSTAHHPLTFLLKLVLFYIK